MALRVVFWYAMAAIAFIWLWRRPLAGVCFVIVLMGLNPAKFGLGLEDVRFQFIITICLLISYLLHFSRMPRGISEGTLPMWLFLAWIIWIVVGSSWAVYSSIDAVESAYELFKIFIFVWLIAAVVKNFAEFEAVVWTAFITFALKCWVDRWGAELGMGISKELTVGFLATASIIYLVPAVLVTLVSQQKWKWWVLILMLPGILDFVVLRGMRSGFASLVAAAGAILIFSPRGKKLLTWSLGGAMVLLFVFVLANDQFWDHMEAIRDPKQDESAMSRFAINDASYEIIRKYPMGIGRRNYPHYSVHYLSGSLLTRSGLRAAHNTILNVTAETGFVGMFLWGSAFGVFLWRMLRMGFSRKVPVKMRMYARGLALGVLVNAPTYWTHTEDAADYNYWVLGIGAVLCRLWAKERQTDEATEVPEDAREQLGQQEPQPALVY